MTTSNLECSLCKGTGSRNGGRCSGCDGYGGFSPEHSRRISIPRRSRELIVRVARAITGRDLRDLDHGSYEISSPETPSEPPSEPPTHE